MLQGQLSKTMPKALWCVLTDVGNAAWCQHYHLVLAFLGEVYIWCSMHNVCWELSHARTGLSLAQAAIVECTHCMVLVISMSLAAAVFRAKEAVLPTLTHHKLQHNCHPIT